jgi:hypothetical protein
MRSRQNTATASESLHVPVGAAAATTEPAPTRALRVRVVGATAIASAASVAIDNTVMAWAGAPTYGAPIKEVLAFHAENRAAVAIAVGLEALNVPAAAARSWQRILGEPWIVPLRPPAAASPANKIPPQRSSRNDR